MQNFNPGAVSASGLFVTGAETDHHVVFTLKRCCSQ
jgi:hypothetical protein